MTVGEAPTSLDDNDLLPLFSAMRQGFARCTLIVDETGDPIDYRFDAVNELFTQMTGLVDPVGRTAHELVPGLEPVWVDTYARVAIGGERLSFELGSEVMGRWFEVFASPLGEAHTFAIVFTDQTVRHEAQLAAASSELRFLRIADELPVNIWLRDASGAPTFVNQTFCDYFGIKRSEAIGGEWHLSTHPDDGTSFVDDFHGAVVAQRVFANRVRVRNVDGDWRWMESWGTPRFGDDGAYLGHLGVSIDITDRVEAEQERSSLLDRERQARHRAEILESHAAQLASVATSAEIAHALIENIDEAFGLSIAAVNLPDGDEVIVVAGRRADAERVAEHQGIPLETDLPGPVAIVANEEIRLATRAEIADRFPSLERAVEQYGIETLLAVPLRNQRREALGSMVVGAVGEDFFDPGDLALLRELALQTGQALDRAQLYEQLVVAHRQQRDVAVRLQQALLPDSVVAADGVEIHAHYVAADDALQVGGDWYDTFTWETGEIAIMVGDVVGHDLEAAARMGRLRAATGALVPLGPPRPSEILRALDLCARGPEGVDFVTAVAVVVEPQHQRLSYANAGHPPAIVVHTDGRAELLQAATIAPLGRLVPTEFLEMTVPFEEGATVVLYSDGLVERPGQVISDDIEGLAGLASESRGLAVDALVGRLIDSATAHGDVRDDIVVVALRSLR